LTCSNWKLERSHEWTRIKLSPIKPKQAIKKRGEEKGEAFAEIDWTGARETFGLLNRGEKIQLEEKKSDSKEEKRKCTTKSLGKVESDNLGAGSW